MSRRACREARQQRRREDGRTCASGSGCSPGGYLEVPVSPGTYVFSVDTCAHSDSFASISCMGGATPPVGTPDAVFELPEAIEVKADGVLLTCEPAEVLPMAQRYFLL